VTQRFWSWLAVEVGKRAGVVALVGLIITLVLGFGITKLDFATGQDSYLNKGEQTYKDSVAYQDLFGGQAMLGVITMDDGHTIDEIFDAEGIAQFQSMHDELSAMKDDTGEPVYVSIITPLIALEYTDDLIQGGEVGGNPATALAGQLLLRAVGTEQEGSQARTRREQDLATSLTRISKSRKPSAPWRTRTG